MNTFYVSPLVTVCSLAILGAVVIGGTREGSASSADRFASLMPERCAGGTEVSSFVCRNTWMASTRHGVR
jgi:hypothetical protein